MAKSASYARAGSRVSLARTGKWHMLARRLARTGKGQKGFWGEPQQSCD